jgi:hypothetical protein
MSSAQFSNNTLKKLDLDKAEKDVHLGIIFPDEKQLYNPLYRIPDELEEFPELYYVWLLSQPEYFWFTCKEILGIDLHPFQTCILESLWNHRFPLLVGSRGAGKSYILAVYALLRLLFLKNRKIVICGSGFRQSKFIFQYMEQIIRGSKILRNLIPESNIHKGNDHWKMSFGENTATAIPIGTGDSIRGMRANDIISDEFAAQNPEIFETVIAGFGVVSSSPTEKAAAIAKREFRKKVGLVIEEDKDLERGNQLIISGTAYYSFNHFAKYHDRYRKIIKSRGNKHKLREYGLDEFPVNWKDYCVIRIPVDLLPPGFMDDSQIGRSKATTSNGIFEMEFGAVFSADSNGFFKRTTIESCVVNQNDDVVQPSGKVIPHEKAFFEVKAMGDKNKEYIMGVDPAFAADNFAIVILELNGTHRSVVYTWTTNKAKHKEKLKNGVVHDNAYYSYCARKIRGLMALFNISKICIDAQGGGYALIEALNDKNLLQPGEFEVWPIIDPENPQDTDCNDGRHILELVQFSRQDYTTQANHGLLEDLQNRKILFPFFDGISLIVNEEDDSKRSEDDINLNKIIEEIEELKDELTMITVTRTATGREHWDTPEFKLPNGKKGRMVKDRYSALIMANKAARDAENKIDYTLNPSIGGFASSVKNQEQHKKMFSGPATVCSALERLYNEI